MVIQRIRPHPWRIYFIDGRAVRAVNEVLSPEERRKGIVAKFFAGKTLEDCVEALKTLGFEVDVSC